MSVHHKAMVWEKHVWRLGTLHSPDLPLSQVPQTGAFNQGVPDRRGLNILQYELEWKENINKRVFKCTVLLCLIFWYAVLFLLQQNQNIKHINEYIFRSYAICTLIFFSLQHTCSAYGQEFRGQLLFPGEVHEARRKLLLGPWSGVPPGVAPAAESVSGHGGARPRRGGQEKVWADEIKLCMIYC